MSRIFVLGWVAACMTIYVIATPFIAFDLSILIPKSSGDVASWVQAVGSIAAIVAAGFFPVIHDFFRRRNYNKILIRALFNEIDIITAQINMAIDIQKKLPEAKISRIYFSAYNDTNPFTLIDVHIGHTANQVREIVEFTNVGIDSWNSMDLYQRAKDTNLLDLFSDSLGRLDRCYFRLRDFAGHV